MKRVAALILLLHSAFASSQNIKDNQYYSSLSNNQTEISTTSNSYVDEAHGTLHSTIPIYSFNYGGLQIPISIQYVAQGIRVGQKSSEVGLGWNLNAVGQISREILGFPDEGKSGGLNMQYELYNQNFFGDPFLTLMDKCFDHPDIFHAPVDPENPSVFWGMKRGWLLHGIVPNQVNSWVPSDFPSSSGDFPSNCELNEHEIYPLLVKSGNFDLQPDIFNLASPFMSGAFFLDKGQTEALVGEVKLDGVFVPMNGSNSIACNYSFEEESLDGVHGNKNFATLNPFVLSTSNGAEVLYDISSTTRYSYNKPLLNNPLGINSNDVFEVVSDWYPSRMTNKTNGKYIEIQYTEPYYDEQEFYFDWKKDGTHMPSMISTIEKGVRQVSSIICEYGRVDFIYDENIRLDDIGLPALDLIIIEQNGVVVKTIDFNYVHMGDSSNPNARLILDEVLFLVNGEIVESISLEYFNENLVFDDNLLASDDHWGFPNASSTSGSYDEQKFWDQPNFQNYSFGTAEKAPSLIHTRHGALSGFTSSTGYGVEYEFGLHQVTNGEDLGSPTINGLEAAGGLRIERITSSNGNGDIKVVQYNYELGKLKNRPNYLTLHGNQQSLEVHHSTENHSGGTFTNQGHVIYGKVFANEIAPDQTSSDTEYGKTVNYYDFNAAAFTSSYPHPSGSIKDWTSGHLKRQEFLNSNDQVILEKEFFFSEYETGIEINGYKPALANSAQHADNQNLYTIAANYFLLDSITETEFENDLTVNTSNQYFSYDESSFGTDQRNDQPIEIRNVTMSGEETKQLLRYASNYSLVNCVSPQDIGSYSADENVEVIRFSQNIGYKNLLMEQRSLFRNNESADWGILSAELNEYELFQGSDQSEPRSCSGWTKYLDAPFENIPINIPANYPYGIGDEWIGMDSETSNSYILYTTDDQQVKISQNNSSSFFSNGCHPCNRALRVRLRGHAGSSGNEYHFLIDDALASETKFIPAGAYFVGIQIIRDPSCSTGGDDNQCPNEIEVKITGLSNTTSEDLLNTDHDLTRIRLVNTKIQEALVPTPNVSMSSVNMNSWDLYESFVFNQDLYSKDILTSVNYNDHNNPVEIVDDQNDVNSIQYLPVSQKVHAQINHGSLETSRYTSFEGNYHGGWEPDLPGIIDLTDTDLPSGCPSYAPTGNKIYHLEGNPFNSITSGTEFLPDEKYILSFYSSGYFWPLENPDNSYDVISHESKQVGEWVYHEYIFEFMPEVSHHITMGGNGFIDELRLHQVEAKMTTKGYYPDGKLMFEADALSSIITYEYDSKGRLEWVLDEERYVIEYHEYIEKDILDENSFNEHTIYSAKEENLQKAGFSDLAISNPSKVAKSTTFIDGWGRHRQTQTLNVNSTGDGVVSFSEYDDFGRELKKYLPYVTSLSDSETYIGNAKSDQESYYLNTDDPNESTSVAFTKTTVENSPFQRPLEQTGVGEDFQSGSGHTVTMEYGWNVASENVRKWHFEEIGPDGGTWANSSGVYVDNELKKVVQTDRNGNQTITFSDALGREVASGRYVDLWSDADGYKMTGSINQLSSSTELVLSYSVYDAFGRLRYSIPAKAIEQMEITNQFYVSHWQNDHVNNHHEFISYYGYDEKGRLVKEKRPSENRMRWYYFDQRDRLILEHLPHHSADMYNFYKYDSQNRIISKGELQLTGISDIQTHIDGLTSEPDESFIGMGQTSSIYGYSNQSFPTVAESDVMQVFYFDNYDFSPSADYQFQAFEDIAENSLMTRGLATGSQTRILPADGSVGQMLMTISYYDERRRPIQAITENHKGGYDRISNLYNERGQIKKTIQHHKYQESSTPVEVVTEFIYYSISGKLRTIKHQVDDDPSAYVSNRGYDDFGRLKELNLHKRGSANYMQSIDYRYNEKGQLTHINNASLVIDAYNEEDDDVFGQELMYHQMSPEAELQIQTINYPEPDFNADYNGNISGMIWNVKTPDEDGAETNRHLYTYQYDDLGQLIEADYGMDHPSDPGQFNRDYGRFSANYNYDLGGNITRLQRRNQSKFTYLPDDGSGSQDPVASADFMDDLTYTYRNGGFLLDRVDEGNNGMTAFSSLYSHFTDGVQQNEEYTYDEAGRNTSDLNKGIITDYNQINKPQKINLGDQNGVAVKYTYDAAGNKLAKKTGYDVCQPYCVETDYIGNFVYENGELKMIYHPEGVVRPTPEDSGNETAYVYDYFIKDYLGNVRVVLTGENATEEVKFLATMEEVHRLIESENFDNLDETAAALPSDYPVGGSVELNERIAYIIADGEMTIGPSLVTPVRKGETVNASVEYFYEEDAPGATYDNLGFFVDEILVSLASSAAGVVPIGEGTLTNIASGNTPLAGQLYQFLANNIDTTDMSHPHGYLVYIAYDNRNQMIPANSGAIQVTDPNQLRTILTNDLVAKEEGFYHIYVSNGSSAKGVNFDNFLVTLTKGKTRQINHYYPYGLPIAGIDGNHNDYLNKYTGKEHQTGEFMQFALSDRGVEMFDFDARFFEPQLARWVVPDPAMQFSNPYLGIGNNPVMNIDPDGEFIVLPALIGAGMGVLTNGLQNSSNGHRFFRDAHLAAGRGAIFSAISAGIVGAPNSLNSLDPTPSPSDLSLAVPVESLPGHVKRAIGEEGLANLSPNMSGTDYWNEAGSTVKSSFTDYQRYGIDRFGHFEVTNYRIHKNEWTKKFGIVRQQGAFANGTRGGALANFNSVFEISGSSTRGHNSILKLNSHSSYPEQIDIYADVSITTGAGRYTNVEPQFTARSQVRVDGELIDEQTFYRRPDGAFGNGSNFRYAGDSNQHIITRGDQVVNVRLRGNWAIHKPNVGSPPLFGVNEVNNHFTVPTIPFQW